MERKEPYQTADLIRVIEPTVTWRDLFLMLVGAHWLAALAFYTWFDPHEPFLWLLEFLPLLTVLLADAFRPRSAGAWIALGCAPVAIFLHNLCFFYLPYR